MVFAAGFSQIVFTLLAERILVTRRNGQRHDNRRVVNVRGLAVGCLLLQTMVTFLIVFIEEFRMKICTKLTDITVTWNNIQN